MGVYALFDEAGNVVYVGSGNVNTRIQNHFLARNSGARAYFFDDLIIANNNLTRDEALGLEQLLIDAFGGPGQLQNAQNVINPSQARYTELIEAGAQYLQEALEIIALYQGVE